MPKEGLKRARLYIVPTEGAVMEAGAGVSCDWKLFDYKNYPACNHYAIIYEPRRQIPLGVRAEFVLGPDGVI